MLLCKCSCAYAGGAGRAPLRSALSSSSAAAFAATALPVANRARAPRTQRLHRAAAGKDDGPGRPISEDVLARLRVAEEEAARLRRELAAAQSSGSKAAADVIEARPSKRIDSTDNRESPFSARGKRAAWLTEADVDFFTGGGPPETAELTGPTPEQRALVQKRLLLGALAVAGLSAFSLVPSEKLRLKPSKPLFFYLVPLLRTQQLLAASRAVIEAGDWPQLRSILSRISGEPNSVRQNLTDAIALLDDAKAAAAATAAATEFMEFLGSMDYNTYFDQRMGREPPSGAQQAAFVDFSMKAQRAAQAKLAFILAAFDGEQMAAARQQTEGAAML